MTKLDTADFAALEDQYPHAVIVMMGADGYPTSVATDFTIDTSRGVVSMPGSVMADPAASAEGLVSLVFSHINPTPGQGYDQRRYVTMQGTLGRAGDHLEFLPSDLFGWDENETPFFQYSEETVPQAHRYMDELSRRSGTEVRPKLDLGWLALRTLRAPFLTATWVPVLLGIALAATRGSIHWGHAGLTLLAASLVHLGLNVANDVFDTRSGADAANVNPTQFSGGSRVAVYGLVKLKTLERLSLVFYAVAAAIGIYLAAATDFWPLFILGLIGVLISVFYTAPPLKLVHRGLGEIAVFAGFGPVMLLGAYFVQREALPLEAWWLSVPVGILIALVLYVNEIPDRAGDAKVGKNTLPVRWSKAMVINAYIAAVLVALGSILVGVVFDAIAGLSLIALLAAPLAPQVVKGMRDHYDNPYVLMGFMGKNIQLHAAVGFLLVFAYGVLAVWDSAPSWLS